LAINSQCIILSDKFVTDFVLQKCADLPIFLTWFCSLDFDPESCLSTPGSDHIGITEGKRDVNQLAIAQIKFPIIPIEHKLTEVQVAVAPNGW